MTGRDERIRMGDAAMPLDAEKAISPTFLCPSSDAESLQPFDLHHEV